MQYVLTQEEFTELNMRAATIADNAGKKIEALEEVIYKIQCIEEEGHNFSSDDSLAKIFNITRAALGS